MRVQQLSAQFQAEQPGRYWDPKFPHQYVVEANASGGWTGMRQTGTSFNKDTVGDYGVRLRMQRIPCRDSAITDEFARRAGENEKNLILATKGAGLYTISSPTVQDYPTSIQLSSKIVRLR